MCDPMTIAIASFALAGTQTVAQYQQARGEAKVQTALHNMNQRQALKDMQQQMADLGARQLQEQQAAAEETFDRRRQALIEASSATARIGESGASGLTMSALMQSVYGQAGRDITRMNTNREWNLQQIEREKQGVRSQAISRMNGTTPGTGPSPLAAALKIGSAALDSYSYYKANK